MISHIFTMIFKLYKVSHDVAEVIADENPFSYFVFNKDNTVTVKFPGGIIHDTYPCHHCALEEVTRIWFLIREAEIKAQRCYSLASCSMEQAS